MKDYTGQKCSNCGKDRLTDKYAKNWVKGLCKQCYINDFNKRKREAAKAGIKPVEGEAPVLKPQTENQKKKRPIKIKIDKLPDIAVLTTAMVESIELIATQLCGLKQQLLTIKGVEAAERYKLYQRLKSVEAFVEESFLPPKKSSKEDNDGL